MTRRVNPPRMHPASDRLEISIKRPQTRTIGGGGGGQRALLPFEPAQDSCLSTTCSTCSRSSRRRRSQQGNKAAAEEQQCPHSLWVRIDRACVSFHGVEGEHGLLLASTRWLLIVRTIHGKHSTRQDTAGSSFALAFAVRRRRGKGLSLSRLRCTRGVCSKQRPNAASPSTPAPAKRLTHHIPPILPRKAHRRPVPPRPAAGRGAIWSHERSIMMRRQAPSSSSPS